jgi:hypothetical protein
MQNKYSKPLYDLIGKYTTVQELEWIYSKSAYENVKMQQNFVATPRFIGPTLISNNENKINDVDFTNWSLVRLVRVYFLTKIDPTNKESYIQNINTLFETAENNEAVALISALPFLGNPESFLLRATDAVRSNIGSIFDAIAFQNPFPKLYFSELAWNQLVLKCIFNDKPIFKIEGIYERTNQTLANSISDLAHERWAAGRTINYQAWRMVIKYLNEGIFMDICKMLASENYNDQAAAALVCYETDYLPAKNELNKYPELLKAIQENSLAWRQIE